MKKMKENHSFSNLIVENKSKQAHEFYSYVQEIADILVLGH